MGRFVNRPSLPGFASTTLPPFSSPLSTVIDLTFDDDDEDTAPLLPPQKASPPRKTPSTRKASTPPRPLVPQPPQTFHYIDYSTGMATARVLSPGEVPSPIQQEGEEWQENLNIHMMCPECKEFPPNIVEAYASGDLVCGSCGLVLGDKIVDMRSEWRTFSNDDGKDVDPSRVGDGPNVLLNGDQLDTRIAASSNIKARELQRAQGKTTADKATKGLLKAYEDISALCEAQRLPKVVSDTAKHIYKLLDDARALKGKTQESLVASCIFIACRQNKLPRSFREITKLTNVPKKEIGRTFKTVEKFLQDHNKKSTVINTGGMIVSNQEYRTTESSKAKDVCRRFCSQLRLSPTASYVCEEVAERMSEKGSLAGRSPLSIAAVCIYMCSAAMGDPKSPKDIGAVCGVSDGTIRSAYKGLYPEREQLINKAWLESKGGDINKLPTA